MFKKAFTLAEVLIVIAIIGAVASLTIPNISDSYKSDKTVVKLRKFQNELQSAQKQAILKYGTYDLWYSTSTSDNTKISENKQRLLEFLEVTQTGVTFPDTTINGTNGITKVELKDGTILAVECDADGKCTLYVATDGYNSSIKGKNIFKFLVYYNNGGSGDVVPEGRGSDRASDNKISLTDNINGTNWAVTVGNLDYLKCAASLNWETKTSCD